MLAQCSRGAHARPSDSSSRPATRLRLALQAGSQLPSGYTLEQENKS